MMKLFIFVEFHRCIDETLYFRSVSQVYCKKRIPMPIRMVLPFILT